MSFTSLRPILISVMLFSPLAWIAMEWWLKSFAYRINVHPLVFLFAAVLVLAVALLIVSTQTIRAARVNPVETLRNE